MLYGTHLPNERELFTISTKFEHGSSFSNLFPRYHFKPIEGLWKRNHNFKIKTLEREGLDIKLSSLLK